jgi:hypothetical protein
MYAESTTYVVRVLVTLIPTYDVRGAYDVLWGVSGSLNLEVRRTFHAFKVNLIPAYDVCGAYDVRCTSSSYSNSDVRCMYNVRSYGGVDYKLERGRTIVRLERTIVSINFHRTLS